MQEYQTSASDVTSLMYSANEARVGDLIYLHDHGWSPVCAVIGFGRGMTEISVSLKENKILKLRRNNGALVLIKRTPCNGAQRLESFANKTAGRSRTLAGRT